MVETAGKIFAAESAAKSSHLEPQKGEVKRAF